MVSDDGPGYPPEMLGQMPEIRPVSRDGTGIGLHLARQVAALHANGGRAGYIELSNDGGAAFCLSLPQ